jgi:hypothetical protein
MPPKARLRAEIPAAHGRTIIDLGNARPERRMRADLLRFVSTSFVHAAVPMVDEIA